MKPITDTGVRGYLKWLQQDQPNLYAYVAPLIAQKFPQAFSDHEQSVALGWLSDTTGAAIGDTTYFGESSPFDDSASVVVSTSASGSSSAGAGPDVASAANTGATSTSVAQGIANLVTAAAQAASQYQLTQAQIQQINNVNQQQAQHIAAGNPPLSISTSSFGIPFISGLSTTQTAVGGTFTLLAIGAGVLWLLSSRKGKAA
jgi:hypothetical protein